MHGLYEKKPKKKRKCTPSDDDPLYGLLPRPFMAYTPPSDTVHMGMIESDLDTRTDGRQGF